MKAKIDLDKFVRSLVEKYYEKIHIDPTTTKCWLDSVLEDQGLEYKDGEIVKIPQESEEERIRKELIALLQETLEHVGSSPNIWTADNAKKRIAWLEKQGDKPQGKSALEAVNEEKVDSQNCVKSADKIEPKFKNGQWVVWQDKYYKVNYNGCGYELFDQNGLSTSLEYETIDESAHLWTIQDAKDGDVLAFKDDSYILLVKEVHNTIYGMRVSCYCHVLIGKFETAEYQTRVDGLYPATKEQRDALMKAMADAGYTFDFDKKELKKIEDEEYNGEDYGIDSLFHAQRILEKTLGKVAGYQTDDGILAHQCAITAVKKLYEKKPDEWSEEDSLMIDSIIDTMKWLEGKGATNMKIDWLKSLKDRVQLQSQSAWSEEDEKMLNRLIGVLDGTNKKDYHEGWEEIFLPWLKSLKPKKQWKPSEEQMDALEHFVRSIGESGFVSPYDANLKLVHSLLNDLKKLREE